MMKKLQVLDYEINTKIIDCEDYVSLTDLAKYKGKESFLIINNWMRNTSTIEFLGLWEIIKDESGSNTFYLPPQKWIKATNAIGIVSKSGKYGGTFAHIALVCLVNLENLNSVYIMEL